ncbi:MAG: hypothetical protein JW800_07305 [Candidatus Omnitrophica bacterium]|nr:hypothetical protein [Candidatus Omnitrophota bacterium]
MAREHRLNDRQKDVLKIVVLSHIKSASPIGSLHVSDVLGLSSATIRNVMGELEDMGYIAKPHTSAGRIPTRNGYRYYVNNLMELDVISDKRKQMIEMEYYKKRIETLEEMLGYISHLLSELTRYAGIACISNLKFYMEGTSNMADIPEFKDVERMKNLLRLFDEKEELFNLIEEDLQTEGVKIHIGEEGKNETLRDLSLITANYNIKKARKGSLGVLGPVRMNYSALIPLVDFVSKAIEEVLDDMEI